MTPIDVLNFWFEETKPEQHFKKDAAFDTQIKQRFLATYWAAVRGELSDWRATPEGRLAEIIILDQFSRNMFRNDPQAFAHDPLALALAQEAVRSGDDMKLAMPMRRYLYLPFEHSESRKVHADAAKLFESLGDEESLKYELLHKEIIDRFGRYPHRNAILGRASTDEEQAFLKEHKGF
jgi:uncharacterized protein (DUF924 family)